MGCKNVNDLVNDLVSTGRGWVAQPYSLFSLTNTNKILQLRLLQIDVLLAHQAKNLFYSLIKKLL